MGVSPPQNQIPGPPGELQKGWSSQPGCRRGLAAEGKVILQGGVWALKEWKQATEPSS